MNNFRLLVPVIFLAIAPTALAITAGQIDDFENGTEQGWDEGNPSPNPPVNVASGGPQGANDNYLRNVSGGAGDGSRMVMFNRAQWTGNYNAEGVETIRMWLVNEGNTAMQIRVAIRGSGNTWFSSTTGFALPTDGQWRQANFSLNANDMTLVQGGSSLSTVLDNVIELRILSSSNPNFRGQIISATLGVDDIEAVTAPEPEPPAEKLLDLEALPNVAGSAAVDVAVLVADAEEQAAAMAGAAQALTPGINVYVRDGSTGSRIAEMSVLDNAWQAIDLAVMSDGGANALVGVLAQRFNGLVGVAVHRADDGTFVRQIAYFNQNWEPSALAYVADAGGPGVSAFAVVAKNSLDNRVSVQVRRISDGSLINTLLFFRDIWDEIDLGAMADISGNGRPEIFVVGQSNVGRIVTVVIDAMSGQVINRISYFGAASTPRAITQIASIGGSGAPELPLLAAKGNGRNTVQSRDAITDALSSSVFFFNTFWNSFDIGGLDDVNGNTSADMVVFAQHDTKGTIQGDVRDAATGALIQNVKFLGPVWTPHAFAVFTDITGNGVQELGVVARNGSGDIKVQLRDASTGLTVKTMNVP